jgi:iron complex outermembrane receptor protein
MFVTALPVHASQAATDLTQLSLEELMNVKVTSVSKTPQPLSKVPAAVFVLTAEDIKRSGATTIPDALRSIPGVQVAQIDANKWAVSIRGFNDRFANKLLVLIDGRSVYTPLFSGTLWNVQDTLLEDIDRIEVIRGPGGTIWGANAVNGVINIITKSAKDTHGGYVAGGYGSIEDGFGEFRAGHHYGGFHFRGYGKYFSRDNSTPDGEDDWRIGRGGFRADWDLDTANQLTFQGDLYEGDAGTTVTRFFPTPPFDRPGNVTDDLKGGNLLLRYRHEISEASDITAQVYYDHTYFNVSFLSEDRDTFDVDVRYRFPATLIWSQEVIATGGYRTTSDDVINSFEISLDPTKKTDDTFTWSVQDEIRLVPDVLHVTLGSKFEHNDYTGFEYQPRASATVYLDKKNTLWGAVTRAVRTPSRVEQTGTFRIPVFDSGLFGLPVIATTTGDEDFDSEKLLSYEAGVKSQVSDTVSVDVSGFYSEYHNYRTTEIGSTVFTGTSFITNVNLDNRMEAETYGAEVSANWFVTDQWRLRAGYSYLHINMHPEPASDEGEGIEDQSPAHQASLHSSHDLPWNLFFDAEVRYVGELANFGLRDYIVADLRLAWRPHENWEVSVAGLDLFDARHFEFAPSVLDEIGHPRRVGPSVYGKISVKF